MKLESHSAYLDQTLARYKIPTGCYFCWPIIGPSSVRATVGRAGDTMLTPWTYLGIPVVTYCIFPAESVNSTSMHLGEYEDLKNTTYDPYIAMRSAYFDSSKAN